MSERSEYAPGTFCWIELGTTDTAAAKKFYTELLGLTAVDAPYVKLQRDGKDVAALYELNEEQRSQGIPPHWLSYVSVSSADDAAARAEELGGTVLKQPFDVYDVGRMAMIQDPTGAAFAVWEPRKHQGAQLANEPGTLAWNELLTNDVDAAGEFYTKLFGWGTQVQQIGPGPYTVFMVGDRPNGGMMKIAEEWGNVPSNWMAYIAVEDCDQCADKAKELGAKVTAPPTDIPEVGRFAMIQDPQGAMFAIIKLDNPD